MSDSKIEYPHMLYRDGKVPEGVAPAIGSDCVIVADEEAEAEAAKNGYLRAGSKPAKLEKADKPEKSAK